MQIESHILSNYDSVMQKVRQACIASNRDAKTVHVLTVTKYASAKDILTLLSNRDIAYVAESRLQDSIAKWAMPQLAAFKVKKFFIGHLQTNKAAKVLQNFDVICSLDSLKLADILDAQAQKTAKQAICMLQVKLADRQTQGGISLAQAQGFIDQIKCRYKNIVLKGIMAIAPIAVPGQDLVLMFNDVKQLFDFNFTEGDYLSLGMSDDFQSAIAAGSNLPRIGSAIFTSK